jgi:type VI secretion system protein ImpA
MSATPLVIDSLVTPLADDAPSGPALDHDPDFQALERAAAGTPERQYGDKIYPAEPPDWPAVFAQAQALAARTRDLRLAVWLARSGARLQGFGGFARGLQLVRSLLEQLWPTVHPQLDAEDDDDPTMRLNALLPLYAADAALADLRTAGLAAMRGSLTLRELELGLGRAEPHGDEARPTEAGVLQGLQAILQSHPEVAAEIGGAIDALAGITSLLESKVGSRAPDAAPLARLLAVAGDALARVGGVAAGGDADASAVASGAASSGNGAAPAAASGGAIRTRADALRELERVCEWLERNEPSNPAPLLIRRAQRLMNMSFIEIIRDMASNGLDQVETVVGRAPEA